MKTLAWAATALAVLFGMTLSAQTKNVYIYDNNGNHVSGTVDGAGNVFFHDSNGNNTWGTVKGGDVFLSDSQGHNTFGTVKDGNVFLTTDKGITTGTIQNGSIFLSSSDGSITTGTYDSYGHISTSTSGGSSDEEAQQRQQDLENRRQRDLQNQQAYEQGKALGNAVGNAINGAIANHHINSYCKANPTGTYVTSDGISIDCPKHPFDTWEQQQIDAYCANNPGSWMGFGQHRADCLTPLNPPNLKWAKWEMDQWRWDYRHPDKAKLSIPPGQMGANFGYWQQIYCQLGPTEKYKDLNGKKQHCP